MIKLKRLVFVYILFLTLSVIVFSCCNDLQAEIYDVEKIVALDKNYLEIDTVHESFTFQVYFKFREVTSISNLGLINSAYALTCPVDYVNLLSSTGFEFFCDQDFLYKNDTIRSGTGLSSIPELQVFLATDPFSQELTVTVTDSFLSNAQFTKGNHLFSFNMETTDKKSLKGDLSLVMDL